MNKITFLIICLCLLSYPAFAADGNPPFNSASPAPQTNIDKPTKAPSTNNPSSDKQGTDDFYNELIKQDYGSNQSPAFDNTEEINPGESDYGYSSN